MPENSLRSGMEPSKRAELLRDQSFGVPSARNYLLTILGEFAVFQDGPIWTNAFIAGLGALGVDEKTVRQTLARTSAKGLLEPEKIGRRTRWHLTLRARTLLREGSQRIYSFHTKEREWDKRWIIILIAIPEARRDARYSLRVKLGWAGFALLNAGVWICPWTDRLSEAESVLEELSLQEVAHIFVGSLSDLDEQIYLAAEAWDIPAVEAAYEHFEINHFRNIPQSDEEAFVQLTRLVNDWRRLPLLDPDLPTELLPTEWVGNKAARDFLELHNLWKPRASDFWRDITAVP
ncbi:MAG: PaaX family transcriptional regulator [Acidimicrobiaceae bacterium]|nr:PaaX family transcriptional regulator [Acidimicrobiaceae bacterium]